MLMIGVTGYEFARGTDARYGLMGVRQKRVVEFLLQDSGTDLIFKISHFYPIAYGILGFPQLRGGGGGEEAFWPTP